MPLERFPQLALQPVLPARLEDFPQPAPHNVPYAQQVHIPPDLVRQPVPPAVPDTILLLAQPRVPPPLLDTLPVIALRKRYVLQEQHLLGVRRARTVSRAILEIIALLVPHP